MGRRTGLAPAGIGRKAMSALSMVASARVMIQKAGAGRLSSRLNHA